MQVQTRNILFDREMNIVLDVELNSKYLKIFKSIIHIITDRIRVNISLFLFQKFSQKRISIYSRRNTTSLKQDKTNIITTVCTLLSWAKDGIRFKILNVEAPKKNETTLSLQTPE